MTQEEAVRLLAVAVKELLDPLANAAAERAKDALDATHGISSTGIGPKSSPQLELERLAEQTKARAEFLKDLASKIHALCEP
jgi:hypothetical protein